MQGIAAHLSGTMRVLTPLHPGWNGAPRPGWLSAVSDLAAAYLQFLQDEGHRDVLVIGFSMGGWIGADMAARDDGHLVTGLVVINSVGVLIEGQPIRDFFALAARSLAEYSFYDPDRFYIELATVPPEQAAQQAANMATMRVLAGDPFMHDPGLASRLGRVEIPVLVLWGDSDRIVTPGYGQGLAAMFAGGRSSWSSTRPGTCRISSSPPRRLARSTPSPVRRQSLSAAGGSLMRCASAVLVAWTRVASAAAGTEKQSARVDRIKPRSSAPRTSLYRTRPMTTGTRSGTGASPAASPPSSRRRVRRPGEGGRPPPRRRSRPPVHHPGDGAAWIWTIANASSPRPPRSPVHTPRNQTPAA